MLFKFDIELTESDYLDFNIFHALESKAGKKVIKRSLTFFIIAMAIIVAAMFLTLGFTTFSVIYATCLLLFTLIYALGFKKILTRNIKKQLNHMRKSGKLPFDPMSVQEFHSDKLLEITDTSRTETNYAAFEHICIVKNRFILLYKNSVSACILPMAQVTSQVNYDEFMNFLAEKFTNIENY